MATTAMAMVLYERGLLNLESPVASILPEFVSLAPASQQAERRAVTVRMLLAHSSGLPAYVKLFETAHTRDELIRAALATPLVAVPGSKADYSDIGFILLGEVLAKLAGTPLDVFATTGNLRAAWHVAHLFQSIARNRRPAFRLQKTTASFATESSKARSTTRTRL